MSQNDIGAAGTIYRENYSTSFDNFSFANDLTVTRFQWAGGYELINADGSTTASADSFTIGVYANDTTSGMSEPGAQLYSFDVGLASETKIAGVPGFYEYSAYVSPFAVAGGETYWFSVVANLDYLNNEWGLGYSDLGDDVSFQDIGQFAADPLTRVKDSVDYAFSVSAVPEPSTFVCFASMGLVIALRRRRCSTSTRKMRVA
ncbi:hypothetical protein Mal15_51370 [Stieleria maiorica]|uniref:Ice-binding protein C-terminal domain-containing protein n=1 Tax=Stieleria maiorica TaxID=2795974 RepID=A0A5B9MM20_9BACT|nr:hypothetical protein Mal15_51370 [Stieleria maiorica]